MTYYGKDGCGYDHPGDVFAEPEPPPYPAEWTAEQRVSAYWYVHSRGIKVRSTKAWEAILVDAQRTTKRHLEIAPRRAVDE